MKTWLKYDKVQVNGHLELSGCITTLTVRNFCAAMGTFIDQDGEWSSCIYFSIVPAIFIS